MRDIVMRVGLVIIPLLSLVNLYAQGGQDKYEVDTVYSSNKGRSYLIFPTSIDWADIGSQEYVAKKDNKTLFIVALQKDAKPASIVIKYGDNIFHGTLAFAETLTPQQQIINFNDIVATKATDFVNEKRVEDDQEESLVRKVVDRRLGTMEGYSKDEQSTIAQYKDKIIFKTSIMRKDDEVYYFKLDLYNKSKLDFHVDYIDFTYKDEEESGLIKKSTVDPIKIYERNHDSKDEIVVAPKKFASIYAAIKQYAVGNKGWLEITIREKKGMRLLSFEIEEEDLIKIKEF